MHESPPDPESRFTPPGASGDGHNGSESAGGPPPERSALAVIALAASCLLCCPFTGAVGFLLGSLSLSRIRASDGRLGGRRIALAAMGVGFGSLVAWLILMSVYGGRQQAKVESMFVETITATLGPASAAREEAWRGLDADQRAALETFAADVRARYGALVSVSVENVQTGGRQDPSRLDAAIFLNFENGRRPGAASLHATLSLTFMYARGELLRLVILDQQAGELKFEGLSSASSSDSSSESSGGGSGDVSETEDSDTPTDGGSGG